MKVSGILAILFATALTLSAQTTKVPDAPKTPDIVVKDTPASQALIEAAKSQAADQTVFNTKLQQAQYTLDASNKALTEQINAANKDLNDKLKADKKYKPLIDKLTDLQKQLSDNGTKATTSFTQEVAPLQQKIQTESSTIQALLPVVQKENGLPKTVTFDPTSNKWVDSAKK